MQFLPTNMYTTTSENTEWLNGSSVQPPQASEQQAHQRIRAQLDFYFSDNNLTRDTFLRQVMREHGGAVPVQVIANFPKIREIYASVFLGPVPAHMAPTADPNFIVRALLPEGATETVCLSQDGAFLMPRLRDYYFEPQQPPSHQPLPPAPLFLSPPIPLHKTMAGPVESSLTVETTSATSSPTSFATSTCASETSAPAASKMPPRGTDQQRIDAAATVSDEYFHKRAPVHDDRPVELTNDPNKTHQQSTVEANVVTPHNPVPLPSHQGVASTRSVSTSSVGSNPYYEGEPNSALGSQQQQQHAYVSTVPQHAYQSQYPFVYHHPYPYPFMTYDYGNLGVQMPFQQGMVAGSFSTYATYPPRLYPQQENHSHVQGGMPPDYYSAENPTQHKGIDVVSPSPPAQISAEERGGEDHSSLHAATEANPDPPNHVFVTPPTGERPQMHSTTNKNDNTSHAVTSMPKQRFDYRQPPAHATDPRGTTVPITTTAGVPTAHQSVNYHGNYKPAYHRYNKKRSSRNNDNHSNNTHNTNSQHQNGASNGNNQKHRSYRSHSNSYANNIHPTSMPANESRNRSEAELNRLEPENEVDVAATTATNSTITMSTTAAPPRQRNTRHYNQNHNNNNFRRKKHYNRSSTGKQEQQHQAEALKSETEILKEEHFPALANGKNGNNKKKASEESDSTNSEKPTAKGERSGYVDVLLKKDAKNKTTAVPKLDQALSSLKLEDADKPVDP